MQTIDSGDGRHHSGSPTGQGASCSTQAGMLELNLQPSNCEAIELQQSDQFCSG